MNIPLASLIGAVSLAAVGPALATTTFTGSTVTLQVYYPNLSTTYGGSATAVVGPGVEFPGGLDGRPWKFDVGASTILFDPNETASYGAAPFNGWVFDFTGLATAIVGVTVDPSSTFLPAGVSWTASSIALNYAAKSPVNGEFALFDVTFAPASGSVPEPAAWALMLVGFAGLGATLRGARRRNAGLALSHA